uniref:Uncharacterized protein n=1 Tax=Rhizophora mucronata TaxID=61149 RepID=A0A2P2NVX9_RHIMU
MTNQCDYLNAYFNKLLYSNGYFKFNLCG